MLNRSIDVMRIAIFTDTYEPQTNGAVDSINKFSKELRKRGIKEKRAAL